MVSCTIIRVGFFLWFTQDVPSWFTSGTPVRFIQGVPKISPPGTPRGHHNPISTSNLIIGLASRSVLMFLWVLLSLFVDVSIYVILEFGSLLQYMLYLFRRVHRARVEIMEEHSAGRRT